MFESLKFALQMFRSLGVQKFRSLGVPLNSVFDASEPSELTEPQLCCIVLAIVCGYYVVS